MFDSELSYLSGNENDCGCGGNEFHIFGDSFYEESCFGSYYHFWASVTSMRKRTMLSDNHEYLPNSHFSAYVDPEFGIL